MIRTPRGYEVVLAVPLLQANAALTASQAERLRAACALEAARRHEADLEALWDALRRRGAALVGQPLDAVRHAAILRCLASLERRRGEVAEQHRQCVQRYDRAVQQCLQQQRRIDDIEDLDRRDRRTFAVAARRKIERDVGERWMAREGRLKEQQR